MKRLRIKGVHAAVAVGVTAVVIVVILYAVSRGGGSARPNASDTALLSQVRGLGPQGVKRARTGEALWRQRARLAPLQGDQSATPSFASLKKNASAVVHTWTVKTVDGAALSAEQREALLEAMATHLAATSLPEPDVYESMAGPDQPYRLIDLAKDPEALTIKLAYAYFFSKHIKEDALREGVRALWRKTAEQGHRIAQVGTGSEGGLALVGVVHDKDEFDLLGALPEEEQDYWLGPRGSFPTMGVPRALVPRTTLEEVIGRDSEALAAEAVFVATLVNGNICAILQQWFWDPALHRWVLHRTGVRAGRAVRIFQ